MHLPPISFRSSVFLSLLIFPLRISFSWGFSRLFHSFSLHNSPSLLANALFHSVKWNVVQGKSSFAHFCHWQAWHSAWNVADSTSVKGGWIWKEILHLYAQLHISFPPFSCCMESSRGNNIIIENNYYRSQHAIRRIPLTCSRYFSNTFCCCCCLALMPSAAPSYMLYGYAVSFISYIIFIRLMFHSHMATMSH